jgi:hypothetical protein
MTTKPALQKIHTEEEEKSNHKIWERINLTRQVDISKRELEKFQTLQKVQNDRNCYTPFK